MKRMKETGRPEPEDPGQVLPREGSGFKNHLEHTNLVCFCQRGNNVIQRI